MEASQRSNRIAIELVAAPAVAALAAATIVNLRFATPIGEIGRIEWAAFALLAAAGAGGLWLGHRWAAFLCSCLLAVGIVFIGPLILSAALAGVRFVDVPLLLAAGAIAVGLVAAGVAAYRLVVDPTARTMGALARQEALVAGVLALIGFAALLAWLFVEAAGGGMDFPRAAVIGVAVAAPAATAVTFLVDALRRNRRLNAPVTGLAAVIVLTLVISVAWIAPVIERIYEPVDFGHCQTEGCL